MEGMFGGLVLESLGLRIQFGLRHLLWVLIGPRAYDWSLETVNREDIVFKEQRLSREILGGITVLLGEALSALVLRAPITFVTLALCEVIVFGLGQVIRHVLEEKSRGVSKRNTE